MALSMDEQRILAEIEIRLSEDDPRLAHRLSRIGKERRRRRIRLIAAMAVAVIGVVTAFVSAIITAFS
ncbi:DUF3040 domain-containing protein [Actinomadura barringtoniae]|uniref:DUF3040 domain-containing protein n=1 Tax=Actinomadura barringtoniae TaxID=1427535 RepID=A0A939T9C8_9ACTN|nr:DUF3040 domain-containing protein [Actinomadura barringtoniae]MBO2454119.1 DUF3040 domain-containing protein [Actinomadura barringtoniae]